jgi:hypothetical protein
VQLIEASKNDCTICHALIAALVCRVWRMMIRSLSKRSLHINPATVRLVVAKKRVWLVKSSKWLGAACTFPTGSLPRRQQGPCHHCNTMMLQCSTSVRLVVLAPLFFFPVSRLIWPGNLFSIGSIHLRHLEWSKSPECLA